MNDAASAIFFRNAEKAMNRQISLIGTDNFEKVGRFTSVMILSRRSSGATS
jgi:hypothetical protein